MGAKEKSKSPFLAKLDRFRQAFEPGDGFPALLVLPHKLIRELAGHPDTPSYLKKYMLDTIKDDMSFMYVGLDKQNLSYFAINFNDEHAQAELERRKQGRQQRRELRRESDKP